MNGGSFSDVSAIVDVRLKNKSKNRKPLSSHHAEQLLQHTSVNPVLLRIQRHKTLQLIRCLGQDECRKKYNVPLSKSLGQPELDGEEKPD